MKGHKGHHHAHGGMAHHAVKHRKHGGKSESPMKGVNEAEMDLHENPMEYNYGNPEKEAEAMGERKHGGRAKRKHGGHVAHKHVPMHGEHAHHHAGRKPRKSGGRAGSDVNPFTLAHHGTAPKGHKLEKETMGSDV
jgi:hypothetical protein